MTVLQYAGFRTLRWTSPSTRTLYTANGREWRYATWSFCEGRIETGGARAGCGTGRVCAQCLCSGSCEDISHGRADCLGADAPANHNQRASDGDACSTNVHWDSDARAVGYFHVCPDDLADGDAAAYSDCDSFLDEFSSAD